MSEINIRYVNIKHCARCGNDHEHVKFLKFIRPIEDSDGTIWDWHGECPRTSEPVLMKNEQPAPPTADGAKGEAT